jgi:hypothetical protein
LFPWLLVGGINGYFLASAAVLVGALIVFPFFQSNVERQSDTFHSALKYAVVINIIMLVTQIYFFYFHGFFFDIHTIIGSIESRGFNESLRYFRPSGFFQEPNAYCAVMFCLLSIRVCLRQGVSSIDYFGILSMILTQSLWGFGASFVILGLIIGFMKATFLVMIIASLAYVLLLLVGVKVSDLAEISVTVARLMNIDDDPSRQARYGSVASWRLDEWFVFGNGVDTSNFQNVAANGVGFLFYSIGIVGLGLLSIWILIRERVHYKAGVSIIFLLTTFPPFAYMYFWVYLSLILTRPRLVQKHQSE